LPGTQAELRLTGKHLLGDLIGVIKNEPAQRGLLQLGSAGDDRALGGRRRSCALVAFWTALGLGFGMARLLASILGISQYGARMKTWTRGYGGWRLPTC
jgi:hypothetical protein